MLPCWREIGIYGDVSCEKLEEYANCRNCPEYSRFGMMQLNQPVDSEYLEANTRMMQRDREERVSVARNVIIFRMGSEWFAICLKYFLEVSIARMIHSVPFRTNDVFLGLVNVNGELIPCFSLHRLIGLKADPISVSGTKSRMMVIGKENEMFAFHVDEVLNAQRVMADMVTELPSTVAESARSMTDAVFRYRDINVACLMEEKLMNTFNLSFED